MTASFISYTQYPKPDGPTTFVTWAERSQYDKPEDLIGKTVLINDQPMKVEGIKRFPQAHATIYNEMIGLIARPAVGGENHNDRYPV